MQNHSTHKTAKGFTLIELVIAVAIIGILASVAIPQFNQYKIRGYDAHSKQALKDMHLLCNAYWLDTDALQGCDLPKIKEATYGFNQNADVVATLPPSPLDNFCASAKHNSSPNTFSIDSASLISSGSDCSGAGGSVQTASVSPAQTFATYQPPEIACRAESQRTAAVPSSMAGAGGIMTWSGYWMIVDEQGHQIPGTNLWPSTCDRAEKETGAERRENQRAVLVSLRPPTGWETEAMPPAGLKFGGGAWGAAGQTSRCRCGDSGRAQAKHREQCCTYNFETGTYLDGSGNEWDPSQWNKLVE